MEEGMRELRQITEKTLGRRPDSPPIKLGAKSTLEEEEKECNTP